MEPLRTAGTIEDAAPRFGGARSQIEQDEIESGELNLIPYLDIVTNLMLFLLSRCRRASSSRRSTRRCPTRRRRRSPTQPQPEPESRRAAAQARRLDHARRDDPVVDLRPRGHAAPRPRRRSRAPATTASACDGAYMCESNCCDVDTTQKCAPSPAQGRCRCRCSITARFDEALFEIANRRYAGKQRKADTYQIVLQADGAIPYYDDRRR